LLFDIRVSAQHRLGLLVESHDGLDSSDLVGFESVELFVDGSSEVTE